MNTTSTATTVTFNFAVVADGADVALFVRRSDAELFARPGEEIGECAVTIPWEGMASPRSTVSGEAATSPEEVIGVW